MDEACMKNVKFRGGSNLSQSQFDMKFQLDSILFICLSNNIVYLVNDIV